LQIGSSTTGKEIGFKSKMTSNERNNFKAGGPIRATGAAIEKMDNLIQTSTSANTFANTIKQTYTPSAIGSNKMPPRPSSSKPS